MAMTKHAARQTFVAICLLATGLQVHGEDKPPARPPKWMPALTAEAIHRLSPKIKSFSVDTNVCAASPDFVRYGLIAESSDLASLCEWRLEPLTLLVGKEPDVLKGLRIVCSVRAIPSRGETKLEDRDHEISTSVYIFKADDTDPARILWNKLRADPATELTRVGDVEVLHRKVPRKKASEDFYYFSPRQDVALVVRGDTLLEDTVRRWNSADPGPGPYPWDLPEWAFIDGDAIGWGFRSVGTVFRIDPKPDKPRTAPPGWMPAGTSDALRRLSPKIDTVLVCEGARPAMPVVEVSNEGKGIEQGLEKDLARKYDCDLYPKTLEQFNAVLGKDRSVLKPFQILCSLQALSEYKPARDSDENQYDAISVHLFKVADVDPARAVWDKLRADPEVTVKRIAEIEVLCRTVSWTNVPESFYYWSPNPGVGVVVRGEKLLEETVQRWSDPDPTSGPFPWSLSEWDSISPNASTWGIGRTGRFLLPAGNAVLSIDPKSEPTVVRLVGYDFPGSGLRADDLIQRTLLCVRPAAKDEQGRKESLRLVSILIESVYLPYVYPRHGP